jgi:hypothetical protein
LWITTGKRLDSLCSAFYTRPEQIRRRLNYRCLPALIGRLTVWLSFPQHLDFAGNYSVVHRQWQGSLDTLTEVYVNFLQI